MKNQIVLTAEEFINALKGDDKRFLIRDIESGNMQPGVLVLMLNIKVDENLSIGMNRITNSWNGPPINFPYRIRIKDAVFQSVEFWSVIFQKPLFFDKNIVFEGSVDISSGEYNYLSFDEVTVKRTFRIARGKIRSLNLFGGEFSKVEMYRPSIKYLIIHQSARIRQLDINTTKTNYSAGTDGLSDSIYYFEMYLPDDIILNIDDYVIERIKLKGSLKSSTIILKDLTVRELFIDKFFNRGNNTIVLSNIKPFDDKSILSFTNSYLGSFVFFDINFKRFNMLNMLNTNLTECIFNNVVWPNNIVVFDVKQLNVDYETKLIEENEKGKRLYSKKRENYRQLKHAANKQGDKAQELFFHSKEMKAYRKANSLIDINDNPILWLSFLTNNHGNNWVYPVLWLILIGALFTYLIMFTSDPQAVFNNYYWDWSLFFTILNPTHRLEVVEKLVNSVSPIVVALDFFSRVIVGFLIYQVIAAFRKFNK